MQKYNLVDLDDMLPYQFDIEEFNQGDQTNDFKQ